MVVQHHLNHLLVLLSLCYRNNAEIQLTADGYRGIVVAISSAVPEETGYKTKENIKTLFTNASHVLYRATHSKAYFGAVSILIPKAWANTVIDRTATSETYETADLLVDGPSSVYGDDPYTEQPLGCGEPGHKVHFSPNYILQLERESKDAYGDPGKVLVHEWAHYRYGVFDEYGYPGDERYPNFYYKTLDGKESLVPNSCSNSDLLGYMKDMNTGSTCTYNRTTGLPDKNCRFFLYDDVNNATTSMMSYSYMQSVESFCDRTSKNLHEDEAPNKHNAMCGGRSTWEVISGHPDFDGSGSSVRPGLSENDTRTTFEVVRESDPRYVLVLDVSGSMHGSRIEALSMSAKRWIQYEVPVGASVGIVQFSSCASTLIEMTKLSTDADRQKLINAVPEGTGGETCIGCGINAGLKMLQSDGAGGVMLLLTDGDNNRDFTCDNNPVNVDLDTMLGAVKESGVRVVTMAFGSQADSRLEEMAEVSDGKTFYIPDYNSLSYLNQALDSSLTYQPGTDLPTEKTVTLLQVEYRGSVVHISPEFFIDATTGRDLHVQIDYGNRMDIIDLDLIAPNGTNVGRNVIYDDDINVAVIDVNLADVGLWVLNGTLAGRSGQDVLVTVTVKSRSRSTDPIITICWLSSDNQPVKVTSDTRLRVLAKVVQGSDRVLHAHVRAQIQPPSLSDPPVDLDLYDSGSGADVVKDDGIYTRYFTQFTGQGRYSVLCEVSGDEDTAVNQGFIASRSLPTDPRKQQCCGSRAPIGETKPTGNFLRSATAGSFQVQQNSAKTDVFPPNQVTDLTAAAMDVEDKTVTLTWTAPGDDLDSGNASAYIIKYSRQYKFLLDPAFDSGVNTTNIPGNTSTPLPHGQMEVLVIFLGADFAVNTKYFFALKAIDDVGNKSPASNIAQMFATIPPKTNSDSLSVGEIVGIVVGILYIVVIIAVAMVYIRRKK